MSLFKQSVQDNLTFVEYSYDKEKNEYTITPEQLHHLITGVVLDSIYDRAIQEEVFKDNN